MKFGKQIQANQIPGWSPYYLDYKALKKIISLLTSKSQETTTPTEALTSSVRPTDLFQRASPAPETPATLAHQAPGHVFTTEFPVPSIISTLGLDEDRDPNFQAHKAAFFFRLERELEKINAFYLQKEAELRLRLETLLAKRRAAAMRVLPDTDDDNIQNHVEWIAVQEGFRLLERDLGKLQQFIEINATGFRKILKKWDKRSKSSTKELYLARQVDVQPVFNRQLISEMSDTVAACLLDITDLSTGLKLKVPQD
ncbi:SPX-domain-containing protein [Neolentinus lepideus HHB14362 ss-1]|uniref:SPX-domain-containing protein n=1 Tax=Neolentinus lepideus HHB14362 ss-1 TaxID=1314782 RepID=A0A165TR08_9AGAM|nr:SPX-domain-containing protein [Neolentinus lepideus HHB14362 ss-1]